MNRHPDNNQLSIGFVEPKAPYWRPIHYLGSKLRFAETICQFADQLDPSGGRVCDVFSGSGTVAMALARTREVVAADIQEYSRVLCSAVLNPKHLADRNTNAMSDSLACKADTDLLWCLNPLIEIEQASIDNAPNDPKLLCDIVETGSIILNEIPNGALGIALCESRQRIQSLGVESTLLVTRYFGGVYMSYAQSLAIDQILQWIRTLPLECRDTATAALLSSVSSIVNTIGNQFAQPIRPRNKEGVIKQHLIAKMVKDRLRPVHREYTAWIKRYHELPPGGKHTALRGDYRDILAQLNDISLVYADPPYTRDHYSRFYHVLETIARQDSPGVTTTSLKGMGAKSRGIYRPDRHQSPFSIKSQAPTAFEELFCLCRSLDASVLLSYSPYVKDGHPRMMTIDGITAIASQHFGHVDVVSAGAVSHSKLNRSGLHLGVAAEAEVFIQCRS